MRILTIGDTHFPWVRKGYLQFCVDLYDQWDCDTVVHIGDVVDQHAISFHSKEPEAPGPTQEYERTLEKIQEWQTVFPKITVTLGNHDKRVVRRAKSVDIPELYLKPYKEIWQTPNWNWVEDTVLDDIYFYHGDGQGGEYPASNAVRKMLMSVVMGHNHIASGSKIYVNPTRRIFACDTGAGCDDKQLAFIYAANNKRKSVMSAAVIIDGIPYVEPMLCGIKEKYHDSNF